MNSFEKHAVDIINKEIQTQNHEPIIDDDLDVPNAGRLMRY